MGSQDDRNAWSPSHKNTLPKEQSRVQYSVIGKNEIQKVEYFCLHNLKFCTSVGNLKPNKKLIKMIML